MTIGEKLTEARTRKGISIREAAEATKIRGEYLATMEENAFAINLPEIYKRGFLRNYARYLKLDPDKLTADYSAMQISRQSGSLHRADRDTYGRIELPRQAAPAGSGASPVEAQSLIHGEAEAARHDSETRRRSGRANSPEEESEPVLPAWLGGISQAAFIKLLIALGGVSVLLLLIVVLIGVLRSGGGAEPGGGDDALPAATQVGAPTPAVSPVATAGEVIVRATASVTLLIENSETRERLFSGTLNAGEATPSLRKTGPLSVRFTEGDAILIELNGQQIRPERSGIGRMLLP